MGLHLLWAMASLVARLAARGPIERLGESMALTFITSSPTHHPAIWS